MGMAASQARYLGLTARKTNVEYEGQQINQARTALSNQSAGLFNQMLTLSVPTPPSTTDFTKVQYAFSDGVNNYELTNVQMSDYVDPVTGEKYNAQVTYRYFQDMLKGIQEKNTNPQVQDNPTYTAVDTPDITNATATGTAAAGFEITLSDRVTKINPTKCTKEDKGALEAQTPPIDWNVAYKYNLPTGGTAYATQVEIEALVATAAGGGTGNLSLYSASKTNHYRVGNSEAKAYDPKDLQQKAAYDQLIQDFPDLKATNPAEMYTYAKNGKTYFATKKDLDYSINNHTATGTTTPSNASPLDFQAPLYQYYAADVQQEIVQKDYARLDDSSGSGRYSSIKLQNSSANFPLKTETVTDQNAYNDAMNQYNYNVASYEKQLEDINAKTKKIQEQDRTLELRLKQLDTEQKALSTEMDAVKGVIQKNVESTFKTFS